MIKKEDDPKLLTDPEDIHDCLKYPKGKKKTSSEKWNEFTTDDLSHKRKRTANYTSSYDDGQTELQFVRMMEKRAEDEKNKHRKKEISMNVQSSESKTSIYSSQVFERFDNAI